MALKIEKVTENSVLGEAPHWDVESQTLYYVDIFGKYIQKYSPATKKTAKASVAPKQITFVIPVEGKKDHFIISLDNDIVLIKWNGESDKVEIIETLATAPRTKETPQLGFNDAKCDSSGRLWAGVHQVNVEDLMKTNPLGSLLTLDKTRQLKTQLTQIKVANGLDFNVTKKKMYFIDSIKLTIDEYDFDITTGTIKNGRALFTLSKHNIPGLADGMTIDADGNLWVALFGGGRVIKIDGNKPETLLQTIELPAKQVTSLTWGGANFDELYVTTGAWKSNDFTPSPDVDGVTYKVTGTGAKGLPAALFKL